MQLPARVIIIEGLPGSGKTTLLNELKRKHRAYDFSEEELLYSWKHRWIPGIEQQRISLMNALLDWCEEIMKEDPDTSFVFERFHLSFLLTSNNATGEYPGYPALLDRLRKLPVHILVPERKNIGMHEERGAFWRWHLREKMRTEGHDNITEMLKSEKRRLKDLLEKQGVPYTLLSS